jgi:hypothetical protein
MPHALRRASFVTESKAPTAAEQAAIEQKITRTQIIKRTEPSRKIQAVISRFLFDFRVRRSQPAQWIENHLLGKRLLRGAERRTWGDQMRQLDALKPWYPLTFVAGSEKKLQILSEEQTALPEIAFAGVHVCMCVHVLKVQDEAMSANQR